jgi:hypothetical protein
MSIVDVVICIGELLDLVDLVCGCLDGDSGKAWTPVPRRGWWPPQRT